MLAKPACWYCNQIILQTESKGMSFSLSVCGKYHSGVHTPASLATPNNMGSAASGNGEKKWRSHFLDAMYLREKADIEKKVEYDKYGRTDIGRIFVHVCVASWNPQSCGSCTQINFSSIF